MTGFSSLEGEADGVRYQLDARSVNGRSLDVRLRLPPGLERHEPDLRRMVSRVFRRGSITLALTVRRPEVASRYAVNHDQLVTYVDAIQALAASGSVAAPRADGLLALKGVIETAGDDEADALEPRFKELVEEVLAALEDNRVREGAELVPVLRAQLDAMDRLRVEIDRHPERGLEAMKARIDRQLGELLSGQGLSPERLHQEAALLATRGDVREELDRLAAHVGAARSLLDEGGPVGRKLDFLAQELNRETNTICAKSPHHAITALGLDLKAAVEQMREQVQNLE
jgi:uncharacterized protein (TIGR00255 family)